MLRALDWSLIQLAFSTPRGWLELGIVALALLIAALADRAAWSAHARRGKQHGNISGSLARVVFPLTAWAIVALARLTLHRSGSTFFLDIALPLLLALVAIRIFVYALRRMFPNATWLKASERSIAFATWGVVVLHFIGFLPELLEDLDAIVIPLGKDGVSLLTLLQGALAVVVTLVATLWISGFIEQRLMNAKFDVNLRVVLAKLTRMFLLTVGVLIALRWIGFDLTLLSVFGGALGVGIGLGLQKLAANYVSGFAILFDRSIRMGDRIGVGDRTGIVTALTARYVVVRDLDGSEAIVPNDTIVTNTVVRFPAYGEARVNIPFPVQPGSDIERALGALARAAEGDPRVAARANKPRAYVRSVTPSAVNLELAVWLENANVQRVSGDFIVGDVAREALAALAGEGIALAQPPLTVAALQPGTGTGVDTGTRTGTGTGPGTGTVAGAAQGLLPAGRPPAA